jgi:ribonuclease HI
LKQLIAHTDGASRGNPGAAALGVIIKSGQGEVVKEISLCLGRLTNNQAEYRAVIAALEESGRQGATHLRVNADSELVVKQLNGIYRVKNPGLAPLVLRVKELEKRFEKVIYCHVSRERNREADALANRALDGK